MCVIAGYLGKESAAPVLLEMLRREEGFAGGFYTGIVTIHEGTLHYAKVVGDTETLIHTTNALQLPGTIGLAHSRTKSGGGQPWAHPFIDTFEKLAYIANGAKGLYKDVDFDGAAQELLKKSYTFPSQHPEKVADYPVLSDGSCVHFSDILCQAIAARFEELPSHPHRLRQAAHQIYQELPGAIVGLCLHQDHPDEIAGVRHNKPMEIGQLSDGSYVIASTTVAFPEGVNRYFRAPALSSLRIHREEGIQILPFEDQNLLLPGPLPSAFSISEAVVSLLREKGSASVPSLLDAAVPLWSSGFLNEKEMIVFPLVASLLQEGKIELKTERVPGVDEQGTAPLAVVHWRG